MTSKTVIAILGLALAFGAAWTLGNSVASPPTVNRTVKNLSIEGDPDHTMAVGRQLIAQLQEHNWNWDEVDTNLLKVPDQEFWQNAPNGPGYWTWARCAEDIYNEVAFYSNLYVWNEFERIPGIEGKLHVSGFYIVGYRDGRVEKVPVGQTRLYPITNDQLLTVFPGMSEYDPNLPKWGTPFTSERVREILADRKSNR